MKLFFLIPLLCFSQLVVRAQNIIQNPSFELGSVVNNQNQIPRASGWTVGCAGNYLNQYNPPVFAFGSPDLFDENTACNMLVGAPANKWATLSERTGQSRYAGFTGGTNTLINNNVVEEYNESIRGTLTES